MVTGWRRAFCTSVPKEKEKPTTSSSTTAEKQPQHCNSNISSSSNSSYSPRISSKFGFFSNPSTPRLQSQPVSSPSLRCRTTTSTATTTPTSSVPNSPKLQCKTTQSKKSYSPRLFHFSNSSSPKSPSTTAFSLLKSSLRLSKTRCGICMQSVRSGQGTATFTAECNHLFHFPCITSHLKKNNLLICPVCNSTWKELPLLSIHHQTPETKKQDQDITNNKLKLRVYNDDDPLLSPSPGSLFNPIPELEENEETDDNENKLALAQEFHGFFINPPLRKQLQVSLLPESAVVAIGRGYETHVVVLKVRGPPSKAARGSRGARRAPVDLVAVLDVSERMGGMRCQMMKHAMKVVISSLNSTDRLSIVAFSGSSKRLLPLKRMTADGRRSARRLVDALGSTGQGMSVNDALKKALKVIEDRRERNPVSTIMILSNGHEDRAHINPYNQSRSSSSLSLTRLSNSEIPVHSIGFGDVGACNYAPPREDAWVKCFGGLLNVVIQDVKIQLGLVSGTGRAEIAAVYSLTNRPIGLVPGSVRIGDLHVEEEREFLVELKVPISNSNRSNHHVLTVRSAFKDPLSQELFVAKEQALLVPKAQAVGSSVSNIQRLKNVHVSTRAVAESRRLMEHGDLSGAYHLLSSARALLLQSTDSGSSGEHVRGLEIELNELNKRRHHAAVQGQRQRNQAEEKPEPLTPTSAWRAAERLAKVAIMRKHMNRVSDLHGFENARF